MTCQVRVFSYPSCSTCRRAITWLRDHKVDFEMENIVENPPSKEFLSNAIEQLGDRKFIFNTSGLSYRSLGAAVIKAMSDKEVLDALAKDGKLIKRPLLMTAEGKILAGFKKEVWETKLL